jgi:adenosylcobinamide-phosphate synthase
VLAVCLDLACGEPPADLHPVVWLGRLLAFLETSAPRVEPARFAYGLAVATVLPVLVGVLAELGARSLPWPLRALMLKPTFSGKALLDAATRVERSLQHDRLIQARADLRWLVSRPTHALDANLVAAAAIESLAENFVDSWLAPLLMYAACGTGGAYAYRVANTADAMWGYHTPTYEYLGKAAARLDDALNFLPARLGALLLACSARRPVSAVRIWRHDARCTASPNAGQTMAAAAGALQVRLEKPEHYVLYPDARPPTASDIAAARALVARAMCLAVGSALGALKIRRAALQIRRAALENHRA